MGIFINKLADHSHHDDLRVDDELVVQNLKLPTNATVEGLTVSHISGLSDSLGNLTIDEAALLASVQTQIDAKADASDVYTKTELDTIHNSKADASTTYTKTQVDADVEKVIKVEEVTNQETSSDTPIMEKITGIFKRDKRSSYRNVFIFRNGNSKLAT